MANRETKLQIVIDAQDKTRGAFNDIQGNLKAVQKNYEGLVNGMKRVGAVSAVAFGGLSLVTKEIIEAGAGFEQTQIAFETMLGSAEVARDVLGDLATFAAKTPFELGQLEESSKRLLAYGTTADELIPTLQMLGDISAGVGMDKLPQLILAFGQVKAATKLTGAELRQFSEAGVPLLGALAAELGKTEAEIVEMVSDGAIGFETMRTALSGLSGEGGKFFNLMERQSASLGGQWSNLKDQISLTARAIGEELLPYLKPMVEKLIEVTQAVRAFVEENPKLSAAILGVTLAITGLMALLFPLALMLPGLVLLFTGLAVVFGVVTAVSAPLLLAIGGVIAILAVLVSQGYATREAWEMVWLGIKTFAAEAANSVIDTVEGMVNFILSGVNKAIEAINKVIRLAQKVPGLGDKISEIKKINAVDFGSIDTNTIASSQLSGGQSSYSTPVVNVTGNNFLDSSTAEQIGDLIFNKLKLNRIVGIF